MASTGVPFDFVWAEPSRTFRLVNAEQVPRDIPPEAQMDLARTMLRRRDAGAVIAGAVPFEEETSAALWVGTPLEEPIAPLSPAGAEPPELDVSEESRTSFIAAVDRGLAAIRSGACDKLVLSRMVKVALPSGVDIEQLISALAADESAVAFACRLEDGYVAGASPELLVSKRGSSLLSGPLAGSAGRASDAGEDRLIADALAHSAKDAAEHAYVVDDIVERLAGLGSVEVDGPRLLATGTIWHLSTTIRALLRPEDARDSLRFAQLLHPTAAVCGSPREEARRLIREIEGRDRGFYAGFVGWQGADGDGDWRLILRSATVSPTRATLDAGAGIVEGSHPRSELIETDMKLRSMLNALRYSVRAGEVARG